MVNVINWDLVIAFFVVVGVLWILLGLEWI
jgi:hypothetical protein